MSLYCYRIDSGPDGSGKHSFTVFWWKSQSIHWMCYTTDLRDFKASKQDKGHVVVEVKNQQQAEKLIKDSRKRSRTAHEAGKSVV